MKDKDIEIKNLNVLIVGGAGFIGHNIAIHLNKLGAKVSIIDSFQVNNLISIVGNQDNIPFPELSQLIINERIKILNEKKIKIFVQDARDYHLMSRIIDKEKPNVLIHLAAVSHANRSNKDPYSTFDHSLRTLENALDASKNKIDHFIYISSSMVYGNFTKGIVDEKAICEPIGIYGALKLSGEKIVIAYNQVFDLPYTIVRPSALYGQRCISRRVGQIFIENALFNKDIIINGDGSGKLDFTYIEDFTNGMVQIIKKPASKNNIFNLTYGSAKSILDMVQILEKHFPSIKVKKTKKENLMPERGTLSVDKAKSILSYNPQWFLEKGYSEYIAWYKDLFNKNVGLKK